MKGTKTKGENVSYSSSEQPAGLSDGGTGVNADASSEDTSTENTAAGTTADVQTSGGTSAFTDSTTKNSSSGTTKAASKPAAATTTEVTAERTYDRSGKVYFSDSPDNPFIAAIVKEYGSDPALLAATYTVPQCDDNTVLEFDGTCDDSGKLIRNGDTLKYIYTLDASYNSKRASQKSSENDGYNALESEIMFYTVKKELLPEYEDELS